MIMGAYLRFKLCVYINTYILKICVIMYIYFDISIRWVFSLWQWMNEDTLSAFEAYSNIGSNFCFLKLLFKFLIVYKDKTVFMVCLHVYKLRCLWHQRLVITNN